MTRTGFAKWLLGITLLGCWRSAVWFALRPSVAPRRTPDAAAIRFVDVTDQAGIRFHHVSGATGKKLLPETMGGGVAVIDFDRDGKPDLFFVNSRPWPGESEPVRKPRDARRVTGTAATAVFEDVTAARWTPNSTAWGSRSATSTTTAGRTSSSRRSAGTGCTATRAGRSSRT